MTEKRLSASNLEQFNRQLIAAAKTGAPLVPALRALSLDMRRGRLARVVNEMTADLEAGAPLSEAVSRRGGAFPPLYAAMLEAAEASGNLHGVMEVVNHLTTSSAALRRRVFSAMIYPAVVLVLACVLVVFVIQGPVTQMAALSRSMGGWGGHPFFVLIARWGAFAVAGVIALIVLALLGAWVSPGVRDAFERVFALLPLYGGMVRSQRTFALCRSLGLLLEGGVPVDRALAVVRETAPDGATRRALDRAARHLAEGATFAGALEQAGGFAPTLVWAVSVSESRGELPEGLNEAGRHYAEDADFRSRFLVQVLPSAVIVFVALIVMVAVFPVIGGLMQMINLMTSVGGC